MKGQRLIFNPESGKFEPGKAGPELIPDELRKLPSEYVTKEAGEPNKVHALDPDYIRENIIEEIEARNTPAPPTPEEIHKNLTHGAKFLTQTGIDVIRARVTLVLVGNAGKEAEHGRDWEFELRVRHLWFEKNDTNVYELREGNCPSDSDRPKHLRNFQLNIDPKDWPHAVRKILDFHGFKCPTKTELNEWKKSCELSKLSELSELRSVPTVQ